MQKKSLPEELEGLLTIDESCQFLKVSRPTFYRIVREGALKTVRVGGRMRVKPDELRRYIGGKAA